jgi:hypothetical protein
MSIYKEILSNIEKGDRESALDSFAAYLDEIGGPVYEISEEDDSVRRLNLEFTAWEQIEIYNNEVDKRPDNPRSWKLLGYAYMCAGLYAPILLHLAEHCLQASVARYEDDSLIINLNDKIEIIEKARRGDVDARKELLETEVGLACAFDAFPETVPVPLTFYENGLVAVPEIEINETSLATDIFGEEIEAGETDGEEEGVYLN